MKESSAKRFTRILTAAGVLLVAAAVLLVIASQITQDRAGKKTALFGAKVRALMPETVDRVPDDRTDMTMPMVEIDGLNFIGIIEKRQDLKIACIEEIAYRRGFISSEELLALIDGLKDGVDYKAYLKRVYEDYHEGF